MFSAFCKHDTALHASGGVIGMSEKVARNLKVLLPELQSDCCMAGMLGMFINEDSAQQ